MCGIVGAVAERDVIPILMEGLQRLEYRGYDSCGVALMNGTRLIVQKNVGVVKDFYQRENVLRHKARSE